MGLTHLDHYNIEVVDLDETIAFYRDALGLEVGDRPPLPTPGAWLYCNGHPTIHLIGYAAGVETRVKEPSGRFHHICFAATDKAQVRERLLKANVKFNTVVLPRAGNTQFFMQDPNGINVELNFPVEETTQEDRDIMAASGIDLLAVPKT